MSPHNSTTSGASLRPAVVQAREPLLAGRRRPAFLSALAVRRQPFFYIAVALIIGILLDRWLEASRWFIAPLAVAAVALSVRSAFVKKATQATLALLVSLAITGAWLSLQEREHVQPREVHIDPADAHVHSAKARFRGKALQLLSGRDLSRGAKLQGGCVADQSSERFADRAVVKPDAIPDAKRKAAAASEHTPHLPQCKCLVGKELQPLLTENHIHAAVPKRKIERACVRSTLWLGQPASATIARLRSFRG